MITIKVTKVLRDLGDKIRYARLRRRLSSGQIAERAGISRPTLTAIEKGRPNVSIGNYAQVLSVLGLVDDLLIIAKNDKLGRKLQDAKLEVKERAPKRNSEE